MIFDWDTNKAAKNLSKHQVSFDEAKTVFDDQAKTIQLDPDVAEIFPDDNSVNEALRF
jgi:uncharacterized protein